MVRCAGADQCSRLYSFGRVEPIDFPDLLRGIAHRSRRKPLILALPRFITSLAKRVGLLKVISQTAFGERMNGLLNQRAMDTGCSLSEFQLILRRFGPVPPAPRRRYIQLAVTLLAYIGGTRPAVSLIGASAVKRLARLFESEKLVSPQLPKPMLYWPSLLRFAEPVAGSSLVFSRALAAATYVFDMTPLGFHHLRLQQKRNVATAVLRLVVTLLIEFGSFSNADHHCFGAQRQARTARAIRSAFAITVNVGYRDGNRGSTAPSITCNPSRPRSWPRTSVALRFFPRWGKLAP